MRKAGGGLERERERFKQDMHKVCSQLNDFTAVFYGAAVKILRGIREQRP